jgi:hypothetical protein
MNRRTALGSSRAFPPLRLVLVAIALAGLAAPSAGDHHLLRIGVYSERPMEETESGIDPCPSTWTSDCRVYVSS